MSGGLPPEGFLYGSSMVYVMQTLAALHTSGWGTVAASGPQMQLINSTWWDKYMAGFLTSIVPAPFMATGGNAYMGQVGWQYLCTVLRLCPSRPDINDRSIKKQRGMRCF